MHIVNTVKEIFLENNNWEIKQINWRHRFRNDSVNFYRILIYVHRGIGWILIHVFFNIINHFQILINQAIKIDLIRGIITQFRAWRLTRTNQTNGNKWQIWLRKNTDAWLWKRKTNFSTDWQFETRNFETVGTSVNIQNSSRGQIYCLQFQLAWLLILVSFNTWFTW
jgi:hypothetical protein